MNKAHNPGQFPFTTPVVSTSNPKDWYIFFQFFHDGKVYERKVRSGINRYPIKERKAEAEGLRQATEDKLKLGWNPIIDPEFKARNVAQTKSLVHMSFCEALNFAFDKKKGDLAKKTRQDYNNILEIVKDHSQQTGHYYLPIKEINRLHIIELLDYMKEKRGWSNHRYNMYLGCIRSMFTMLETCLIVDYNPATKIPVKSVAESDFYASYTEDEKARISEQLAKTHYQLFVFLQVVYHTGIRPKELLSLKVENIDMQRRIITLIPDLEAETTKTKFIRPLPIPNALFPFFKEMYLEQFPGEFYVFGSPFEPGKGNRGSAPKLAMGQRRMIKANWRNGFTGNKCGVHGAMRPDYMKPSPWQASRDTVGRLWKTLVKDHDTGLGINKCLYAAKHTGADDKILAGIDLDALRNLYGHRSKQMTERYAKQIKELYNSTIIINSPTFTRSKPRRVA